MAYRPVRMVGRAGFSSEAKAPGNDNPEVHPQVVTCGDSILKRERHETGELNSGVAVFRDRDGKWRQSE